MYAWPGHIALHPGHPDASDHIGHCSEYWIHTSKGCIPGDNCAHGEAVKNRQCLEWLLGTSLEVKERVASLSGAPAALGSARHWSSIPPMPEPELSCELASITTSSQPPLPFIQQQTTALLTTARCAIMIHGCMTLGCLPGQEESGWGRGWSLWL